MYIESLLRPALLSCLLFVDFMGYSQTWTKQSGTGAEIGYAKDGGAVWGDYDNDGDLDLLINTSYDNPNGNTRLLESDGAANPSFIDVTLSKAKGMRDNLADRSILWGDLNNDGYLDIIRNTYNRIEIYINTGTDFGYGVNNTANLIITQLKVDGCSRGDGMNAEGVGLIDYNNDGWLDILIENGECGIDILENRKQDAAATIDTRFGDGDMSTEAEATGGNYFRHVSVTGNTLGLPLTSNNGDFLATGDYDADGYVDFIVRKPTGTYDLWSNDGDGTFTANTTFSDNASTNTQNANKGGVIFCDFDMDGDLDIYWTDGGTNQIWLQHPTGTFTATGKPTITGGSDIDGCACADVDGDGDLDLFLGNDGTNSFLFKNNTATPNSIAALSFTQENINVNADAEGVNLVDYDDDGDYDIYVNVDGGNNQIWENDLCDGGGCDYMKVFIEDCVDGTPSNRPVVGATVIIKDSGGNIVASAASGSNSAGHGAQNPPTSVFHLPNMTGDYTIDITFPEKNGTVEMYSYDFNAGDIVDNELTLTAVNGTDGSSCDFSLLPVELISFVGTATREGIVLDWVTASELNNERFEIEHSSGDGKFDVIGIVDGNGTTDQEISYSFTHLGPLEGANYYRLRQFDFDGANEVSETIVTFYETTDDMSIYPNPVSDQLNIYLGQRFSRTSMNMVIRDISGKVVWNKSFNAPEQKVELTITHLKPGPYLLEVTNGTYTHVEHIIFR